MLEQCGVIAMAAHDWWVREAVIAMAAHDWCVREAVCAISRREARLAVRLHVYFTVKSPHF